MRPALTSLLRAFEAWCLPSACLACALPAEPALGLCAPCRAELRVPAKPLGSVLDGLDVDVHAALAYDPASAPLLTRYKFHADLAAGRALGVLALPTLRAAPRPDALVAVPLHRSRLRQRGHDQALGLARDWGRAMRLPVLPGLLQRVRATRPQTELHAEERQRNLEGAFLASGPCPAHVALVDDVLTTGRTAAAAVQALRGAGARRVDVWVVAQAARAK